MDGAARLGDYAGVAQYAMQVMYFMLWVSPSCDYGLMLVIACMTRLAALPLTCFRKEAVAAVLLPHSETWR